MKFNFVIFQMTIWEMVMVVYLLIIFSCPSGKDCSGYTRYICRHLHSPFSQNSDSFSHNLMMLQPVELWLEWTAWVTDNVRALAWIWIFPKEYLNQVQHCVPVVPATQETEEGGSLQLRSSRPAFETEWDPISKRKEKRKTILEYFLMHSLV